MFFINVERVVIIIFVGDFILLNYFFLKKGKRCSIKGGKIKK